MKAVRELLDGQLVTAWSLLDHGLTGLEDEECLWRPSKKGLHVTEVDGIWRAEWPESETFDTGPASIAWLTWHIGFWWSMALDHSFGERKLQREDVTWPGTAEAARAWLAELHDQWSRAVSAMTDDELRSAERVNWPFTDRPFYRLAGWVNLELMKNAAEIGYCRFLYATRDQAGRSDQNQVLRPAVDPSSR